MAVIRNHPDLVYYKLYSFKNGFALTLVTITTMLNLHIFLMILKNPAQ
jgi:hypothetical protein